MSEAVCAAPKMTAAPKTFMFFSCGRGRIGGGNHRPPSDESIESCLAEQRCSVPCVTFCFVLLLVRPLSG